MDITKENITKEDYIGLVKLEIYKLLKDGEPCDNPNCLNNTNVPCKNCGRINGIRKKLTCEEMLEKNVILAYDEPWEALGPPDTNIKHADVQIRIKAKDAVNIRRHLSKNNPKYINASDVILLEDFISVNWAYVILNDHI